MKMILRTFVLASLIGSAIGTLAARQGQYVYRNDAETLFVAALQDFHEGRFSDAAAGFDRLVVSNRVHQRTTASYIMSAKAHFQLKEYDVSSARVRELLADFPSTSYRQDAIYILGLNAMMQQKYEDAAKEFLAATLMSRDSVLEEKALTYIELIASGRLSLPALVSAFNDARDPRARDVLALELAGRYSSTGDGIHARQMLGVISRARHPASFNNRFELLDRQLSSKVTVKLGVLLPANSPSSSPMTGPADEVFEGINHALEEYNASGRTGVSVSLIVRNTDGDESSLQSVRELAASSDVIGIVGPLFSNLALAYSPIVNAGRIAMISPTANANGIAAGSEYVFQANPDVHTRGTAMARYAVRDLGYTKLAVLTSSDPLAKGLADEFVQEAQRLGAEVATVETYSKDSSDYRDQFMRIRKAGVTAEPCISFGSGLSRAQVRSMIRAGADPEMVSRALRKKETIPVGRIFGDRGIEIADSLRLPVVSSLGRAENIEIPVTGMQAIFVSISGSEEIGIVASQLSYFNIKAQLLGGGDWYDQSQLDANKRYVNGVLFLADSFEDKQDSAYAAFEQSYLRDRKKSPTRNTLYGYDTMRLLLTQIEGGAHTREDIVKALRRVSDYRGLHASITLSDGRANTNVHILEYRNNEIVKVEEVNVR